MLPSLSVKVFDESEFLHELDHPAESERRGGGAMTRGFLRFVLCPEREKVFCWLFSCGGALSLSGSILLRLEKSSRFEKQSWATLLYLWKDTKVPAVFR